MLDIGESRIFKKSTNPTSTRSRNVRHPQSRKSVTNRCLSKPNGSRPSASVRAPFLRSKRFITTLSTYSLSMGELCRSRLGHVRFARCLLVHRGLVIILSFPSCDGPVSCQAKLHLVIFPFKPFNDAVAARSALASGHLALGNDSASQARTLLPPQSSYRPRKSTKAKLSKCSAMNNVVKAGEKKLFQKEARRGASSSVPGCFVLPS